MRKLLIALTSAFLIFDVSTAFANIEVAGYNPSISKGYYEGKVTKIILAVRRNESGKVISQKHDVLFVKAATNAQDNLMLRFESDDFQTGLALMNAIGKKIRVLLDRNENKDFIVRDITVMQS